MRSTMYHTAPFCKLELAYVKLVQYIACVFSSIKIDYSDHPKSLISRTNEVYVF